MQTIKIRLNPIDKTLNICRSRKKFVDCLKDLSIAKKDYYRSKRRLIIFGCSFADSSLLVS